MAKPKPLPVFKGAEPEPAPVWEQMLMEAETVEEVREAIAVRDSGVHSATSDGTRMAYVEWNEEDHPRDRGRFTSKDGGGSAAPPEMPVASVAEMMKALVEPDSGMTIALSGSVPDKGFVVAVPGHEKAVPAAEFTQSRDVAVQAVDDFLAANADALNANASLDGSRMLGLWHNPATGNVVLDVVEVVEDRESAVRLGAERDQIAIYDIEGEDVIATGGTGGAQASVDAPSRYGRRRPDRSGRAQEAGRVDRRRAAPGSGADDGVTR